MESVSKVTGGINETSVVSNKTHLKSIQKLANINSLSIAIVLTANFIAILFSSLGIIEGGMIPVLLLIALLLSYATAFLTGYKDLRLNKQAILLILLVLTNFALTILFRGTDTHALNYFIEFLAFGLLAYLFTLLPYKADGIIRYTMLTGILIFLNPFGFLDNNLMMYSDAMKMGATYAILPCVLAAMIHFFFMRNIKNFINILGYISNTYLLYLILTEGSRGAVLSVLLFILFASYIKLTRNFKKEDGILIPVLFTVLLSLLLLVVIYIENILLWLYDIGIEWVVLIKSVGLLEERGLIGILNGRDSIYENTFRLFMESPVWGQGIGVYADIYNGQYPHNLFLQLLAEGGFVFIIPFSIVLLLCFLYLIKPWSISNKNSEIKYLILLLFLLSIPRLMLSIYLWQLQAFWLMIFLFLSRKSFRKLKIS